MTTPQDVLNFWFAGDPGLDPSFPRARFSVPIWRSLLQADFRSGIVSSLAYVSTFAQTRSSSRLDHIYAESSCTLTD